jgi:hypothetical protein
MSSIQKDCVMFVERLSDLDPDEPIDKNTREYFQEHRTIILPLLKMYEWDKDFLYQLLSIPE